MSLIGGLKGTGPSGFGHNSTAGEVTEGLDLSGRTLLVTGANSGIGHETARVMAKRGATVLAAARTDEKARRTCERLPGEAEPVVCELSEPDSVRSCIDGVADRGGSLDAVVANAGIMAPPELERKHGLELQFLINHVGHFILVTGLVDQLADDGRVVMLSSDAHRWPTRFRDPTGEAGYDPFEFYGQSKLAGALFAKELARRFAADDSHDRVAMAVHPGVIHTNLGRHMNPLLVALAPLVEPLYLKTVGQGAATQTWAAVHPDAREHNGAYLADCNVAEASEFARDPQLAETLWEETEAIVEAL